jgi:hypothetical protein
VTAPIALPQSLALLALGALGLAVASRRRLNTLTSTSPFKD